MYYGPSGYSRNQKYFINYPLNSKKFIEEENKDFNYDFGYQPQVCLGEMIILTIEYFCKMKLLSV